MDIGLNNKNSLGKINKEFADVVFFVEANSNEQLTLWQEWSKESMHNVQPLSDEFIDNLSEEIKAIIKPFNNKVKRITSTRVDWVQIMSGFGLTIGHVNNLPVFVSFNFAVINGKKICFYDPTSRMVDHTMVEKWLIEHFQLTHDGYTRWNHTDAMNFHNCVNSLDIIDVEPRKTIYK